MEESAQNPDLTQSENLPRPDSVGERGDTRPEAVALSIAPPPALPSDPNSFWGDPAALEQLAARPEADLPSVLQRLGPLPLPRGGFPLIGFLATVYDHVAASATPPTPPSH